ncbi:MAG: NAD(+)/NADH kinase [Actinomycetota bacterium]
MPKKPQSNCPTCSLPADFQVFANDDAQIPGVQPATDSLAQKVELVVVLGGDGTMLRAAETVRGSDIPLLGVNLGRVGFLAEVDKPSIEELAEAIRTKAYIIDDRLVLAYSVERAGEEISSGWALNEVTIERSETTMVELFVQIDHRPLSALGLRWADLFNSYGIYCLRIFCGRSCVWPEVEAFVVVPISAHALFSKPMVVSPDSKVVIDIESSDALLSADSRRKFLLKESDRVTMSKDSQTVRLAHLNEILFTDRLVAKFKLPIEGWRGE